MPNGPTIDYRPSRVQTPNRSERFGTCLDRNAWKLGRIESDSDFGRDTVSDACKLLWARPFFYMAQCPGLWRSRNVILPSFAIFTCDGFAELIYFGAVMQLTLLQQFCRYDVYEQRRNLQICADLCKFFVAQLTILQYFPLFVFSFGIDIALT